MRALIAVRILECIAEGTPGAVLPVAELLPRRETDWEKSELFKIKIEFLKH